MWVLPRPGIELMSPALQGRFLATEPSGKPMFTSFYLLFIWPCWVFVGPCIQLNNRNTSNSVDKWAEELDISPKKTDRWLTNTWKDAQHHSIREMQIKTTMRYHFMLVRIVAIQKSANNKYWSGYGEKGTLLWHFYSVPKKMNFFGKKIKKKHIWLHLSDLLFQQFSDCHIDYINFSSYEVEKENDVSLNSVTFPGSPAEAWKECHAAENHKKAGKLCQRQQWHWKHWGVLIIHNLVCFILDIIVGFMLLLFIDLPIWTFVGKVMSLLFNMLSRFVIAFLPRNKCLLISWLQSPSEVILVPNCTIFNSTQALLWKNETFISFLCKDR